MAEIKGEHLVAMIMLFAVLFLVIRHLGITFLGIADTPQNNIVVGIMSGAVAGAYGMFRSK